MDGSIQVRGARTKKSRLVNCNSCGSNILDLPEHVLTYIISLLPMKDAVRTSVLSKAWEYKWTSVYNIVIDDRQQFSSRKNKKTSFINFVDRILLLSKNIKSFSLKCRERYDPFRLKTWISSLSRHGVQSIEISSTSFHLPHCLFGNTSLTRLKLELTCTIKVPSVNNFSKLTYLSLCEVNFQNEHFSSSKLILTFPVLETLELKGCTWVNVKFVEINSPALTTFKYFCFKDVAEDYQIKICGAKLEKFEIYSVLLEHFDFNASSVVHADMNFICERREHPFIGMGGLSLKEFTGLKYLRLTDRIEKTYAQLKPGLPLPLFDKLEHLELHLCRSSEALLELLHVAPTLKLLTLDLHPMEIYDLDDFDYDDVGSKPSCILSHLKKVNFNYFTGTAPQLHLAEFLMKNSMKLEEISVSVPSKPLIPKAKIKRLISKFPQGSACVSFVFKYSSYKSIAHSLPVELNDKLARIHVSSPS